MSDPKRSTGSTGRAGSAGATGRAGRARAGRSADADPSVQEALLRARGHARNALSEALLAVRALIDAASIGLSGRTADEGTALGPLVSLLEEASRNLASQDRLAGPLVEAILDALDHEVRRWEERARDDAEARAVLRAFLGVREILWEFGLRREGDPAPGAAPDGPVAAPHRSPRSREGRSRVERVRVQG
ncbi:MAG: hypothetical protein ACQGVK_24065 [Myxococcota bacterium]